MLEDIHASGAQETLLFVSDELTGVRDVILEVYPQPMYQSCWVHVQRNIARHVRAENRKEILDHLKPGYQASNQLEAQVSQDRFNTKIAHRYPKIVRFLNQNQSLFSFMVFSKSIQSSPYITNLLEGMNKQVKKYTKRNEQFPNEASLD